VNKQNGMAYLADMLEGLAGIQAQQAMAQNPWVVSVQTDTRATLTGALFIALRGERFDAHTFLAQARASGAVAALVEFIPDDPALADWPIVQVADTRVALGQLAALWRRRFDLPVITVMGSNGKTTVKEMLAAIARAAVGEEATLATLGNLNNDIGLPLTVLKLRSWHRLAVLELGMNHPGETAGLAAIAQPTVALINNAQREHQEFMHTVEAVAEEHAAGLLALSLTGAAVFPADSPFSALWRKCSNERAVYDQALSGAATVTVTQQGLDASGRQHLILHTPVGDAALGLAALGEHNVRNALTATAAGLAAGLNLDVIVAGLSAFSPVKGRLQSYQVHQALKLIDDTYNANPDSVRAAIDVLAACPSPRMLILGDMGEVGENGPQFHAEVGAYARCCGIETLYAVGKLAQFSAQAFGEIASHYQDAPSLLAEWSIPTSGSILVKGSRFMRMERIVEAVLNGFSES
jgi:UDP-N-acetylmuramoyl-tripeptide--D-alanyl-D-alanine ligase